MKLCTKCNELKSLDLFSNNSKRKDGKQHYCKDCHKLYYKNNLKKLFVKSDEWYKKGMDKENLRFLVYSDSSVSVYKSNKPSGKTTLTCFFA